jgi:hypothetical protein
MTVTTFKTTVKTAPTVSLRAVNGDRALLRKDTSVVATVTATVTNTGDREGDEIVQIFASAPNAGQNGVPLKSMVAYERLRIDAGATVVQTFDIQSHHFTFADSSGLKTTSPGKWRLWAGVNGDVDAVEVTML